MEVNITIRSECEVREGIEKQCVVNIIQVINIAIISNELIMYLNCVKNVNVFVIFTCRKHWYLRITFHLMALIMYAIWKSV